MNQSTTTPIITFETVTKQFGPSSFALQDVSFTINPGELVVITGHSGSGKTTLMRLITREYKPSSGEITFQNQPLSLIKSNQVHHHRRNIGVVFQDYRLLPELNVWENIALALKIINKSDQEIEERVTDLLELVRLPDKASLFPSQLSGGEAQRISIARALATAPSVIFADEPTGNLDPETSVEIARLLHKIHELGTTVLFATHDSDVLAHFKGERRLHLEHGKVITDETITGAQTKTTTPKSKTPPPVPKKETPPAPAVEKTAPTPSEDKKTTKESPTTPTSEETLTNSSESDDSKPAPKWWQKILPAKKAKP
jgi:cell division transport system ATP-binding protein